MSAHHFVSDALIAVRVHERSTGLKWAVALLTMLYALLLLPAWQPRFLNPETLSSGLDSGWAFALHALYGSGLQFGRDLVFTYGPLGFLDSRYYYPGTFGVVLLRSVAFSAIFWFALWSLADRSKWDTAATLVWLVALTTLAATLIAATDHAPEYFLCVLLLATHFSDRGDHHPLSWWLLVLSLAFASLIKFSYFIAAIVAVGAVTFDDAALRRRFPAALPLFAAAVIVFYLIAGQQLSLFPSYLADSVDLAGAYSLAMGTIGPAYEVVLFLVAAVALVVASTPVIAPKRFRRLAWAAALSGVLWVLFKQGYVRHWHVTAAALELALIVTVCLPYVWQSRSARPVALIAVASAGLLAWIGLQQLEVGADGHRAVLLRSAHDNTLAIWKLTRNGTADFDGEYRQGIQQLVARNGISGVTGTVDVYPWDVWIPAVYHFEYRPRPVFQSYAAYTPALADLNASHLTSPRAPETLLFTVKPIDDRLPTLEDAPSWPIILTNYKLDAVEGGFARLSRSTRSVRPVTRQLERSQQRLGSPFPLPIHDGPLLLAVDLRPSMLGRLWSALYKGAPVVIDVWTRNGEHRTFKYLPTLANVPFLISPMITDTTSFAALASGDLSCDGDVARVAFDMKRRDRWQVSSRFTVTVSTVDLTRRASPRQ